MIDALIAGRIYGAAVKRTAANGNSFVTAKVRVPTHDGEAAFANVLTFSQSCGEALLALQDGDSTSLSGELKVSVYQAKDGAWRPSLDLTAHVVLTAYHVARRRLAMRKPDDAPDAESVTDGSAPAAVHASADREFNDDCPF